MTADLEELQKAIDDLNGQFYEQTGEDKGMMLEPFVVKLTTQMQVVGFFGMPLWDSENDEREPEKDANGDEDDSEPEPIRDYLVREANKHLNELRKVALK